MNKNSLADFDKFAVHKTSRLNVKHALKFIDDAAGYTMSGKTAEVVLYETMKQAKQQEKTLTSCSTNDYLGEERRSA